MAMQLGLATPSQIGLELDKKKKTINNLFTCDLV
jgi:hypothetical protein